MSDGAALVSEFAGKIAMFFMNNGEASLTLEYIEVTTVGDRLILSGRIPERSGEEWVAKLRGGVAWEHVSHYVLFDTQDDFTRRTQTVQKPLRRLLDWLW